MGRLRAASSPPSLLPMGMMESSDPDMSMPTCSQQEEGVELQGHGQWLKHTSFWHPKGHPSWPFIPQPDKPVSNGDKSVNSGLQIHSKTQPLLWAMV